MTRLTDAHDFRNIIIRFVDKYGKKKLSKFFGVGRPTIQKWIDGENLPHTSLQHVVLTRLRNWWPKLFEEE